MILKVIANNHVYWYLLCLRPCGKVLYVYISLNLIVYYLIPLQASRGKFFSWRSVQHVLDTCQSTGTEVCSVSIGSENEWMTISSFFMNWKPIGVSRWNSRILERNPKKNPLKMQITKQVMNYIFWKSINLFFTNYKMWINSDFTLQTNWTLCFIVVYHMLLCGCRESS